MINGRLSFLSLILVTMLLPVTGIAGPNDPIVIPDPVWHDQITNGVWFTTDGHPTYGYPFDEDGNGVVTEAEALLALGLIIVQGNVEDITGLHYFENITSLKVRSSAVTEVNIAGLNHLDKFEIRDNADLMIVTLSSLPNWKRLWLISNQALTTITMADVPKLDYIFATQNLSMSSIDFYNLPGLRSVYVHDNALVSLNITDCNSLSQIDCSNNQITDLDLSYLPGLNNVDASNNRINQLDLTGTSQVASLDLNDNLLDFLDLGINADISTLEVARNNLRNLPDLTLQNDMPVLLASHNLFQDVDAIVANPAVGTEQLDIEFNKLTMDQCDNLQVLLDRAYINDAWFLYNWQGGPGILSFSDWPQQSVLMLIDDAEYQMNCW